MSSVRGYRDGVNGAPADASVQSSQALNPRNGFVDDQRERVADLPSPEEVQRLVEQMQARPLHDRHLADLRASGLSDEAISAAGICSATAEETVALGFHRSAALVFPYPQHPGYVRIKPDDPRYDTKGKPIKYESPRGGANFLYVPQQSRQSIMAMGGAVKLIVITEGEKKALAADQVSIPTISVPGVWGWRSERGALQELDQVEWRGRPAVIIFDSDIITKVDVKEAVSALVIHLRQRGAEVRVVVLPDIEGRAKTGLDDFLVAHGRDDLQALIDGATDWFSTLLGMLSTGLSEEALEEQLRSIYRFVVRSTSTGSVAFTGMAKRLRDRLKALGYTVPPLTELKKSIREAESYTPDWAAHRTTGEDEDQAPRFVAEGPGGRLDGHPELQGLYDQSGEEPRPLTNFSLFIDRDVAVDDSVRPQRRFEGRVQLLGEDHPFAIDAKDFASNSSLTAKIFEAAGPKAQIFCQPEMLRTAISAVSSPITTRATTNFGWIPDGTAYRTTTGIITANGFRPVDADEDVVVDLTGTEFAKRLDMQPIDEARLLEVKQHIVTDFTGLHPDRRVGFALLAAAALAVLFRFLEGYNRFSLWLVGHSGTGKSFISKLWQNFFGDFPIGKDNTTMSWISTAKRIQWEGYFFRDAGFVVDDFKPDHCPPWEATWVLQSYADAAARGRLRRDATPDATREIRGLLLSTGEDVPDHSASASARMIKLPFATAEKNLTKGRRCLQYREHYAGVMADFIRHLLANGRPQALVERVAELQTAFYSEIAGRDNDVRIAGNFAMLGAAFEEMANYLAGCWPEHHQAIEDFVTGEGSHLRQLRDDTLADVGEQKASSVFLITLAALLRQGAVLVKGAAPVEGVGARDSAPLIGRVAQQQPAGESRRPLDRGVYEIWTEAALGAVQESLRRQGRPALKITIRALLREMVESRLLLDEEGNQITADSEVAPTRPISIDGRARRAFRIRGEVLTDDGRPPPRGGAAAGGEEGAEPGGGAGLAPSGLAQGLAQGS